MKKGKDMTKKTPWHLWVVGIFFMLLCAVGAYDYIMSIGHNVAYFTSQNYSSAQIIYFSNYTTLPLIFRTIGIISALAASILLFFRNNWTPKIAYIAVISQICLDVITFGFMNRWNIFGATQSVFDIIILLVIIGFFIYSRRLSKQGILK